MVSQTHADLSGDPGTLRVEYAPSVSEGEDTGTFRAAIAKARSKEVAVGATTLGPHRDDLRLLLDNVEVNKYASRGQARTVALALQLAQADFLEQATGDPPVLLLDDVLSELDQRRRKHVLEKALAREQVLLTAAGGELLDSTLLSGARRYIVEKGSVIESS
jgi:DNA replication and repair protein RecF